MLGDLLLVTQQFKEFSDKTRMDPAVAPRKKKEYCDKLFSMFTKGEILPVVGEDGTCTQAIIKQIKVGHVFFNGAHAIGLSIPPGEIQFVQDALQSMQRAVEFITALLDIVFDSSSFEASIEAFDVHKWLQIMGGKSQRSFAKRQKWEMEEARLLALNGRVCKAGFEVKRN